MPDKIIRLCYRKIIDASATRPWDKYVFNDTYTEFLMQAQLYNGEKKYALFSELVNNVPAAEKLHFLVSAAAVGYLKQLNGIIPDMQNALGKLFLPFKQFRFEIIESGMQNKGLHKVAINFISEPLTWHDTVGDYLLVSVNNQPDASNGLLTDTFQLQPYLSIFSLKTASA